MFRRLLVLIAASLSFAAGADVRVVEEIAAKVNGDIVTKGELDGFRKEYENELRQRGQKPAQIEQALADLDHDTLRDKIDELLLVQKAKELNIDVKPELTREITRLQGQAHIFDQEKFSDWVRQQFGLSLEDYKQREQDKLMAQYVIQQQITSKIFIPQAELQKYYDEHKDSFVREEQVYLSQIVLSTDGKTDEQIEAIMTKAKDLVKRARAGEKFSELASANSDDADTAKNGGYLGTPLKRADLRKEIADVVFTMNKGQVTDPIRLKDQPMIVILKVEERHEAGLASFDEVRDQIQQIMAEPQFNAKIRQYLAKLRQEAFLEIRDGYVDSGAVPGKDTSWHDVAQVKPQTTTKAEVAARRRKRFLGLIPYGRMGPVKPAAPNAETAPIPPAATDAPAGSGAPAPSAPPRPTPAPETPIQR
jgi:peptidyl-prolyl cis-trans isomerase SurA